MNLTLQPGDDLSFQFTPLPEAVLDTVDQLTVRMERTSMGDADLPIYLYNWTRGEWEQVSLVDGERQFSRPSRYLGPENAVRVRLNADDIGGFLRLDRLVVEQSGEF
jgi:hypothetical protein